MIDPIVSAHWLQSNHEIVTVCDVRPGGPADPWVGYLDGHLPGAALVDLDAVLAGPPAPIVGRHPLPDPVHFAKALGALGIGNETTVVAYDDMGGAFAGRLVWMLRIIGQPAALLDGGRAAWTGVIERGQVEVDPVDRRPIPWPAGAVATGIDVIEHLGAGGVVIDSRAPERYRGETEPIDDIAGHVPGAINLPFAGNLDGDAHFLDREALVRRVLPHR